jgi:hypothetical protein
MTMKLHVILQVFRTLRADKYLVIVWNLVRSNLCQGVDKICEIAQSCRKMAELHASKMYSVLCTILQLESAG